MSQLHVLGEGEGGALTLISLPIQLTSDPKQILFLQADSQIIAQTCTD